MSAVLDGIRVVESATGVASALAGMLMADFGAEVVRVEPDDGDPLRSHPGFAVWDRGKSSVRAGSAGLIAGADIHITSGGVAAAHRRLITLEMPPYADVTPWAGGEESEGSVAAMIGVSMRQGSFDGGPTDAVSPILSVLHGVWAAACAVAALVERSTSGLGQTVTVGGVHGAMIGAASALTFSPEALAALPADRVRGPGGTVPFYRTYRCADGGWLFLAALTPRFTQIAFDVLGQSHLFEDERLEGKGRAAMLAPANSRWVAEALAAAFMRASRDDWLERLRDAGCPAGAVLERDHWLDHAQVKAIGMRIEVDDPRRGRVVMPGVPIHLDAAPGAVRGPAPVPGRSPEPPWEPRQETDVSAPVREGPLDGFRVVDLGAIIAGPFGASLLAELGADVIKVEPLTGDSFRGPGFAAYNKGQRGIALDLRHPDGKAAFERLVRTADVVVDNYRPGVLGRLGIGWNDLAALDERIISVSVTGFGDGGPFGGDAGFDPVLQAMSGLMRAQGGDSDPVFFAVPVSDVAASACVALGASLALLDRHHTGRGQRVATSLAATASLLQAGELVRFDGRPRPRIGGRDHPGPSPHDGFHRAADGWFRINDPTARADLTSLRGLKRDAAVRHLTERGISAVPARTSIELAEDEHLKAYGVLHPDPRPGRDGWWTAGRHALFSRTQRSGTLVSPSLGQHTWEILRGIGYSDDEIIGLIDADAVGAGSAPSETREAR